MDARSQGRQMLLKMLAPQPIARWVWTVHGLLVLLGVGLILAPEPGHAQLGPALVLFGLAQLVGTRVRAARLTLAWTGVLVASVTLWQQERDASLRVLGEVMFFVGLALTLAFAVFAWWVFARSTEPASDGATPRPPAS